RARDARVRVVVEQRSSPRRARLPHAGRGRGGVLRWPRISPASARWTGKQVGTKPRAIHYVQATSDAAEVLSAIGHRVVRVRPTEEVRRVGSVFGAIAGAHLARLLSDGEGLDPDVFETVAADVVRAGRSMTADELLRVLTELHALSYAFADHFSGVDVVLSLTTAQPPPLIGTMSASRHALSSAWSSLRCSCPRCSVMAP